MSTLDTLPVEILHRIFDHLDASTMIRSVRCVCTRLYAVVNFYDRFQLDFTQFSNSYDLSPLERQINETRNSDLKTIFRFIQSSKVISLILSVIIQTNLQKLDLNNLNYTNIEVPWPNQSTLKQLTIKNCIYQGYCIILSNSHSLRTLVINDCMMKNADVIGSSYAVAASNSAKRQRTSIDSTGTYTVYSQLLSLTISHCRMSMEDLEYLLKLTPSLVNFKLVSNRSTLDQMFVGSSWEQFIRNHLRSLNKFQFFLTCNEVKFNGDTTFNSLISPFQSQFWLSDKRWLVTCDYIPLSSTFRLYTSPICKSIETNLHRFQASSTDSECRFILNSKESIFHNITESILSFDLNVAHCKIGDNLIQCVVVALLNYKTLIKFDLSNNKIGDIGAQYLADALRNHETLTTLDLSANQIGNNGAEYLYNVLKENKPFIQLMLTDNPGSYCDIVSIAFEIRNNKISNELILKSRNIADYEIKFLSESLANNKTLMALDLSNNKIGDIGVRQLADVLRNHETLTKLIIRDSDFMNQHRISDTGAQYLGDALKNNTTLKELKLNMNSCGCCATVEAMVKLRNDETVTTLEFGGRQIGDRDIQYLAYGLENNRTLIELNLQGNQIGQYGATYLFNALRNNTTLKKLNLDGNEIRDNGVRCLADILKNNIALTTLDLMHNKIGRMGAQYLAEALAQNRILRELDIEANHIGNIGAEKLTSALRYNKTLEKLSLNNNQITREIRDRLLAEEKRLCFFKPHERNYDSDDYEYYYESD